jgi:LCP family protein required for cell wall assembly
MNAAPAYAPAPPPRRPRRGGRFGCWLLLFFALMAPVFLCGVALLIYLIIPPAPLDIVVLGLDARPGEGFGTRTDSIMLLGVNPARIQVSMLSVPRDLFVDVPGYGLQRINTVNALGEQQTEGGGPQLLASAITQDFGINVDRYARLNFDSFVQLVDAVGGITIDVDRAIVDNLYPLPDGGTTSIRFDPGAQVMNGERALMYARTRHGDDDYARADRQQQVLLALSRKLINPVYWPAAVGILTRSVDTNITVGDMFAIAPTVLLNAGRFDRLVIDRSYITSREGVAVPDFAQLQPWINERYD